MTPPLGILGIFLKLPCNICQPLTTAMEKDSESSMSKKKSSINCGSESFRKKIRILLPGRDMSILAVFSICWRKQYSFRVQHLYSQKRIGKFTIISECKTKGLEFNLANSGFRRFFNEAIIKRKRYFKKIKSPGNRDRLAHQHTNKNYSRNAKMLGNWLFSAKGDT